MDDARPGEARGRCAVTLLANPRDRGALRGRPRVPAARVPSSIATTSPANAFRLWDRDGDGKVSKEEWKAGTDLWCPRNATLVVFDDVDGDGDSELDRDEVVERFDLSALGEAWDPGTLDGRTFKRAFFALYDTNDACGCSRAARG